METAAFLGFDYGTKSIGVAVGSTQSGLAQALTTVRSIRGDPDWAHISRLIEEWKPQALVVGLPRNMDDSDNEMTQAAQRFGDHLGDRYNLPVHMVDERLTTVAAKTSLADSGMPGRPHKSELDRLAAKSILQAFFDERSTTDVERGR
ncbi:MAG: Holliday junction resolvase RuvX [Acidiferrobacterales bacterium]